MRRGEVWWAEIPPPYGSRPVVILTRNQVLQNIASVVVAGVTSTVRDLPTEVSLGRQQGLKRTCVANMDSILTLPRSRLKYVMGACDVAKLAEIDEAIRISLGLIDTGGA
ncbi:MAG: type II toxin-antitoxin system PemK/MazF family toxin [Candidatus Hydrogenedentes bacterium]|nr:type II toxin-antitoxin system PemK/MazF family toxin [Candidatus Hydrogenedentota bacterium]MBI3119350.1 type II toxin-antitoxin system PemK/MazF family toxin [Candidatus Hydrogenedentota bacterium]